MKWCNVHVEIVTIATNRVALGSKMNPSELMNVNVQIHLTDVIGNAQLSHHLKFTRLGLLYNLSMTKIRGDVREGRCEVVDLLTSNVFKHFRCLTHRNNRQGYTTPEIFSIPFPLLWFP